MRLLSSSKAYAALVFIVTAYLILGVSQGSKADVSISGAVRVSVSEYQQTVNVKHGWNLLGFSGWVDTDVLMESHPEIESVFILKEGGWDYSIRKEGGGDPIGELALVQPLQGAWVKWGGEASTLTLSNTSDLVYVSQQNGYSLGWNLISVETDTDNLRQLLEDNNADSIWSWDGVWRSYLSEVPEFLNSLRSVVAGKGYYIYIENQDNMVVTNGQDVDSIQMEVQHPVEYEVVTSPVGGAISHEASLQITNSNERYVQQALSVNSTLDLTYLQDVSYEGDEHIEITFREVDTDSPKEQTVVFNDTQSSALRSTSLTLNDGTDSLSAEISELGNGSIVTEMEGGHKLKIENLLYKDASSTVFDYQVSEENSTDMVSSDIQLRTYETYEGIVVDVDFKGSAVSGLTNINDGSDSVVEHVITYADASGTIKELRDSVLAFEDDKVLQTVGARDILYQRSESEGEERYTISVGDTESDAYSSISVIRMKSLTHDDCLELDQYSSDVMVWGKSDTEDPHKSFCIEKSNTEGVLEQYQLEMNYSEVAVVKIAVIDRDSNIDMGAFSDILSVDAKPNPFKSSQGISYPFMIKGVDNITGGTNGFLKITPDLGGVRSSFGSSIALSGLSGFTVDGFSGALSDASGSMLNGFAGAVGGLTGSSLIMSYGTQYGTNLSESSSTNGSSAFEYMGNTTFATFDTFVNARSEYIPVSSNGMSNQFSFEDDVDGSWGIISGTRDVMGVPQLSWRNDAGDKLTTTYTNTSPSTSEATIYTSLGLTDDFGNTYGASAGGSAGGSATLTFQEAVDTNSYAATKYGGVVTYPSDRNALVSGYSRYMNDVDLPLVDLGKLSIGDLVGALQMHESDQLASFVDFRSNVHDVSVDTQFFQKKTLDYVDEEYDCGYSNGVCNRYITDLATMHLSNGFSKADQVSRGMVSELNKDTLDYGGSLNSYSVLMDKGSVYSRVQIKSEMAGKTGLEIKSNIYDGDEGTVFGQLKNSSIVTVTLKF